MSTKDLANPSDLKSFLQDTPFAFDEIQPLSGGTANFACRLRLASPYEGRSTLVLKHAKPYVFSSAAKYPFAVERQKFEVEALRYVKALIPPNSFVSVPEVHLLDEEEHVIIMDDCGENSSTLKQFILDGKCTLELAEKIGSGLGEFLRHLHMHGSENSGIVHDVFAMNEQAKQVSAWATYGRLVSTLNGEDTIPALTDPPLHIDKADLEVVSKVAAETQAAMLSANDTFVMGDFWPGNVMVAFEPETGTVSGVSVIDWEMAKTGLPGLDLGQFCAEIDLVRRFHPSLEDVASKTISSFYRGYSVDPSLFRTASIHWGVHLVTWTPRIPWGSREITRETVEAGVRLIVDTCNKLVL